MAQRYNALTLAHELIRKQVSPGAFCIDATAGRGYDTALLCELAGSEGTVLAFDIQQDALQSTKALLDEKGFCARLIADSHANMAQYAAPGSVDCIVFNLGWLPKGDHNIFTTAQSTLPAIEAGLALLKPLGLMSICIYYGRENDYGERDAVLSYLQTLDHYRYSVVVSRFPNRPNNPPIFAYILKEETAVP